MLSHATKCRLVAQAFILKHLYAELADDEDDYFMDTLGIITATGATLGLWAPVMYYRTLGKAATMLGPGPLVYGGALIGSEILEQTGVISERQADNFQGFITGGMIGEEDLNLWDTDANDSGYFNVPKNISTIYSLSIKPKISYVADLFLDMFPQLLQPEIKPVPPIWSPIGNPVIKL